MASLTNLIRYYDPETGARYMNVPTPLNATTANPLAPFPAAPSTVGIYSMIQTTDPGVTNDTTQGIAVGSIWFNATAGQLRWWECRDNTAGAAKWVFSGADFTNGGSNPNTDATQFGSGTSLANAEGNIYRVTAIPGQTCNGTGGDYVIGSFVLPGNSFDVAGRGINILAQGSFSNAITNKRIKIIVNASPSAVGSLIGAGTGVVVADTGTVTANGSGWSVEANVFKYGALGSNTQIGLHQQAQVGTVVTALIIPSLITATESGPINILITGNCVTTPGDISLNFMEVNALN